MRGEVFHGDRLGRELGWPTANILLGRQLEPARGVYAVTVALPDGSVAKGVANVGRRPTLGGDPVTRLEAISSTGRATSTARRSACGCTRFLRPDAKFDGLDELKAAIAADERQARAVFG